MKIAQDLVLCYLNKKQIFEVNKKHAGGALIMILGEIKLIIARIDIRISRINKMLGTVEQDVEDDMKYLEITKGKKFENFEEKKNDLVFLKRRGLERSKEKLGAMREEIVMVLNSKF